MKSIFFTIAIAISSVLMANNISITDISLTGINTTNKTVQVRFSVSWENSWRTNVGPANWDAAWIFVKYRRGGVGDWKHAWLNNTGHLAATGSTIATGLQTPGTAFNSTTNPGIGAFIHRSANGNGTFTANNMQLQWNYGANEVTNTDLVEVKVFAIEMVYVPQGEFAVGDPGNILTAFLITTINTANALTDPSGVGNLGGKAGGYPNANNIANKFKPLVSNFPNGFNAFYCMKYEITQKGYVDFLNTLSFEQQKTRVASNIDSSSTVRNRYVMSDSTTVVSRNGIKAPVSNLNRPLVFFCDFNENDIPNEDGDGLDIACNFLTIEDVWAYLWWAGLRPMTDMEFEKGCRGNLQPVAGEYAWGSAIKQASTINTLLENSGKSNEQKAASSTFNQVIITNIENGPGRVGLFAKPNSTRYSAGAAYYGMMEMTGNVINFAVGIMSSINNEARNYVGDHGNGHLTLSGSISESASWPMNPTDVIRKPFDSTRGLAIRQDNSSFPVREFRYGGRGVRTQ